METTNPSQKNIIDAQRRIGGRSSPLDALNFVAVAPSKSGRHWRPHSRTHSQPAFIRVDSDSPARHAPAGRNPVDLESVTAPAAAPTLAHLVACNDLPGPGEVIEPYSIVDRENFVLARLAQCRRGLCSGFRLPPKPLDRSLKTDSNPVF
jgi:hypothetical protein